MSDLLKKYRQMRDFGDTPEPSGKEKKKPPAKLPIFVIQKHRASRLHYDFRLEMEGVLKSWAVPKGPSYDPSVKRLAMMTEDHPYDYASFEGVIPEGNYGAGKVIIWDNGTWEFIEPGDDPVKALKSGKLTFRINGKKMFGEWALVRIKGRSEKGNEWLLLKHRDAYANDKVDVTEVAPQSVISNLTVEEIGPENIWISNRPATSRKAPTLASRIARASVGPPPSAAAGGGAGATRRRHPTKAAAKKTTRAAPSPTTSARSRSSRAARRGSARPTPRRRLR